jgi:hypothetical protein
MENTFSFHVLRDRATKAISHDPAAEGRAIGAIF